MVRMAVTIHRLVQSIMCQMPENLTHGMLSKGPQVWRKPLPCGQAAVTALGLKCYSCLTRSFRPSLVQLAKRTPPYNQVTRPFSANTSKASSPELIARLSRTPSSRRRYCSVIQARALSAFCSALSPWKVVCWATCRNPVMGLTFISVSHGSSIACLRLTAMGSTRLPRWHRTAAMRGERKVALKIARPCVISR